MSDVMKFVLVFVGVVVLILALDLLGIFWESKIGVWREDVRTQNFEHTKVYKQSQAQDLVRFMAEWRRSDEQGKKSIEFTVRQMFADANVSSLDLEVQDFVKMCKYGK